MPTLTRIDVCGVEDPEWVPDYHVLRPDLAAVIRFDGIDMRGQRCGVSTCRAAHDASRCVGCGVEEVSTPCSSQLRPQIQTCPSCALSLCIGCFVEASCPVFRNRHPRRFVRPLCQDCRHNLFTEKGYRLNAVCGNPACTGAAGTCASHVSNCLRCEEAYCVLCPGRSSAPDSWPAAAQAAFAHLCSHCQQSTGLGDSALLAAPAPGSPVSDQCYSLCLHRY